MHCRWRKIVYTILFLTLTPLSLIWVFILFNVAKKTAHYPLSFRKIASCRHRLSPSTLCLLPENAGIIDGRRCRRCPSIIVRISEKIQISEWPVLSGFNFGCDKYQVNPFSLLPSASANQIYVKGTYPEALIAWVWKRGNPLPFLATGFWICRQNSSNVI